MNYYQILGLNQTAGSDEIKRAFRRLAISYHPDKNPDPAAEETFKQINEAYDVLSDRRKRDAYDRELQHPFGEVLESQPRHRDPAYRPGRPKVYRKNEKERILDLMKQYLPYTQIASIVCFSISVLFLIDYVWPQVVTDEKIQRVSSRRTYSRNGSTTWWVIHTTGDQVIDIPFEFSDLYQKGEPVKIYASNFLQIPRKVQVQKHAVTIKKTIYGNFVFAPLALLIISALGVLARKNVDYGFNLGVTSFVILIFLIVIVLVL